MRDFLLEALRILRDSSTYDEKSTTDTWFMYDDKSTLDACLDKLVVSRFCTYYFFYTHLAEPLGIIQITSFIPTWPNPLGLFKSNGCYRSYLCGGKQRINMTTL